MPVLHDAAAQQPQPPAETLDQVITPRAVVDLDRMNANLDRMATYARTHELALRPHTKTHKTPALAAEQLQRGAVGVTVATPREAEVQAEVAGDILLAHPPVGDAKLSRVTAVAARVRLTVALDSEEALAGLATACRQAGVQVGVLVELDLGMGRVGVQRPADAVALARLAADAPALDYRGVLFYPGHIRQHVDEQDADLAALGKHLGRHLEALQAADLPAETVSGGSTPTAWHSHRIPGMSEFRPGTYIFNDRTTAAIGACAWEDCAYSVLATVISTAVPGQAVVDAGSKALAREEIRAKGWGGLGALLDRPDVVVKATSEEHGLLDLTGTDWRPRVGDRVRIVPNHVCVSVNLHPSLLYVRGERVEAERPVAARGWTP